MICNLGEFCKNGFESVKRRVSDNSIGNPMQLSTVLLCQNEDVFDTLEEGWRCGSFAKFDRGVGECCDGAVVCVWSGPALRIVAQVNFLFKVVQESAGATYVIGNGLLRTNGKCKGEDIFLKEVIELVRIMQFLLQHYVMLEWFLCNVRETRSAVKFFNMNEIGYDFNYFEEVAKILIFMLAVD
ncbi:unnamed protein product [Anisakis simplex]|uniref:Cytochrome P450 n=1 Tax=Anisakis simplex TaxID=6269 RepID=A0A0M3K167_ANISI|nr:unnamed protein product [Anisakis simplex]